MSPTSYQTAPPRSTMVANPFVRVKLFGSYFCIEEIVYHSGGGSSRHVQSHAPRPATAESASISTTSVSAAASLSATIRTAPISAAADGAEENSCMGLDSGGGRSRYRSGDRCSQR